MANPDAYRRRQAERDAKRSLRNAFWSLIVNPDRLTQILLCFFTLGLVTVGFLQWKTLNKTDETLRTIQRPWISARLEIAGDFISDDKGARVNLRYTFKNVGNSAALNVFGFAKIDPSLEQSFSLNSVAYLRDASKELKAHCAEITKATTGMMNTFNGWIGDIIFPGNQIITNDTGTAERPKQIGPGTPPTIPEIPGFQSRLTTPILVPFCVDYQASLEPSHHQTAQIFRLTRTRPGTKDIVDVDPDERGTILAAELNLSPAINWGGEYAN